MGSKRDKHRYVKIRGNGACFVDNPAGASAFLADMKVDEPDVAYEAEDVWMTDAEFEALPEFQGF